MLCLGNLSSMQRGRRMITEGELNYLVIAGLFRKGNVMPSRLSQAAEDNSFEGLAVGKILSPEGWQTINKEIQKIADKARKGKICMADLKDEKIEGAGVFTLADIYELEEWFKKNKEN